MNQFDPRIQPNVMHQAMQAEQQQRAQINTFVLSTASRIYAGLLANRLDRPPTITEEQLTQIAETAARYAPYLAVAVGMPVQIQKEQEIQSE